jgi:hypothetical protein
MNKKQIIVLFLIINVLNAQIIISEVMFNLEGGDSPNEFVELYNTGITQVDISNWIIADKLSTDDFVEGTHIIPAMSYALIVEGDFDGILYSDLIPSDVVIIPVDGTAIGNNLGNTGDSLFLITEIGDTMDFMGWNDEITEGHSLEKINFDFPNTPGNWRESLNLLGTPGFENSVSSLGMDVAIDSLWHLPQFPNNFEDIHYFLKIVNLGLQESLVQIYMDQMFQLSFNLPTQIDTIIEIIGNGFDSGLHQTEFLIHVPGDKNQLNNSLTDSIFISYPEKTILINEIMYDPLTGDPEWIELINNSEYEIDLNNWKIDDDFEDETKGIEGSTFLLPNEFNVISGEEDFSGFLFQDDFPSLNNSGDNLFLIDPANKVIDYVNYTDDWGGGDGFSLERITLFMDSNDPLNWGGSVNPFGSTASEKNSLFVDKIQDNGTLVLSPNPFSPDKDGFEDEIIISYNIPFSYSKLYIDIYAINGILVKSLSNGVIVSSNGFITWDGYDNKNRKCRIGPYILKFEADDSHTNNSFIKIERIILAKKLN